MRWPRFPTRLSALLPLDSAVAFLPARRPRRRSRRRWWGAGSRCGCRARRELTAGNQCRVHSSDGRLIAIGEIAGNLMRPTKVLNA